MSTWQARKAIASLVVGLTTVFVANHSPLALSSFLLAHSLAGAALTLAGAPNASWRREQLTFLAGSLLSLVGTILIFNAPGPFSAILASILALGWSLLWVSREFLRFGEPASQSIERRDGALQIFWILCLVVALILSFADPVASTGFIGVFLVISGLHLAIIAASPRVG